MTLGNADDSRRVTVTNGRVVAPDRVVDGGTVVVEGDRIVEVGRESDALDESATVDARGGLVLPGFVDVHGDELERHLVPRPGARVPPATALVASDRANVATGITTKFHAVAFEEAPDEGRTVELAREVVDATEAHGGTLLADTRIHARCELGEDRSVGAVREAVDRDVVGLVSLMNHVPGRGQFDDAEQFDRRYTDGGQSVLERETVPTDRVGTSARAILRSARDAGVPAAVHDVDHVDQVGAYASAGVSICEYPVSLEAARAAARHGLVTAMGAPNLVRGGSLWDNLCAREAARAGVVDVLCTDYHPPSLLSAVLTDTGEPLPRRVARVTAAPADAVGLHDRGRLESGARADLLVVDPADPPTVRCAMVGGDVVLRQPD